MSTNTKIQWTDATWNPVVGCSRVSAGCKNCYAFQLHDMRHKAFNEGKKLPKQYAVPFSTVQTFPDRLREPLKWRKPRRIFVNSVSDLFHPSVPFEFILSVWDIMARCPQHTFQILTKRIDRALEFLAWAKTAMNGRGLDEWWKGMDVLPNVGLGVSVEDQPSADARIPQLLLFPAAFRFLSCEPLLGEVDIARWLSADGPESDHLPCEECGSTDDCGHDSGPALIGWVIAGGESGPGARPMHLYWARSLRDQCAAAGVPFFFKQWGEWTDGQNVPDGRRYPTMTYGDKWSECSDDWATEEDNGPIHYRVGKKKAGRLIDGEEHNAFPESQSKTVQ